MDRLWIAGDGAELPGLAEWLSSRLGVPVERLVDRIAPVPGVPPEAMPRFARAIAIALSAGAARSRYVDLRKGELRYRGDTAVLRSRYRMVAAGLAALVAAWAFGSWSRCGSLDAEAHGQQQALERLTADVMGRKQSDFEMVRRLLDKTDVAVEGPMPSSDVLDILTELSRRIPSDIRNSVTTLDIEPGKLTINGLTRNAEEAARIPKVLAEYTDCIRDVGTLSGSGSTGDYTYQIEATTQCP